MGDTFAISALHRKRAHLAGKIEAAQRGLDRQRETLATLDAVILLFEPAGRPDLIPAIRPHKGHSLFFRRGEQGRLCLAALREAGAPMSCNQVAAYAMVAKGLQVDAVIRVEITKSIRKSLAVLAGKGAVRKIVRAPEAWWELSGERHV